MNARYFLPYINRFISADTIVPDPKNPQSFNRYSYVENRPLVLNDPSGHCGAEPAGSTNLEGLDLTALCSELRDFLQGLYDMSIEGLWTYHEMALFELAVRLMALGFGGDNEFRLTFRGTGG
jgi:hypothetical protein